MGYSPRGSKGSDMTERLHFLSFFMGGRELRVFLLYYAPFYSFLKM